jgi:hypothetical protein
VHKEDSMFRTSVRVALKALRSALFVVLVLVSRLLLPVLRLVTAGGVLLFGFCVLFRRDLGTPMWAGAALAFTAVALELAVGAALRALAPSDVVVITEV